MKGTYWLRGPRKPFSTTGVYQLVALKGHFFQHERLIVLYIGSSETLLTPLEGLLGPQIAGAERR